MGYSNKFEVATELASVLTSGNPVGSPVKPLISIGNTLTDAVSDPEIETFIRQADAEIDALIDSIYLTPMTRVIEGSFTILVDITAGDTQIVLDDATRFDIGESLLIRSAATNQELVVADILNSNVIVTTLPISSSYVAAASIVDRLRFPDPLPKISARLAAANIYDKHFAAEAEPNQSEFGNQLRAMAYEQINGILAGAIRLEIPEAGQYVGRRYMKMSLLDTPSTKAQPGKTWFKGGK
jgi:hypothetical protein